MARLQQRAASVLLAALLLSAVSVDGAGLWGGSKKSADPVKVAPAAKAVVAATPKAVVPAGDGHNVYWCARLEMRATRGASFRTRRPGKRRRSSRLAGTTR